MAEMNSAGSAGATNIAASEASKPVAQFEQPGLGVVVATEAMQAGLFGHAAAARNAERTHDVCLGIEALLQLAEHSLLHDDEEAGPPFLNAAYVHILLRHAAASAGMLAEDAHRTIEWVRDRTKEEVGKRPSERSASRQAAKAEMAANTCEVPA